MKYADIYFDPKVQEMCVSPSFKCPFYEHSWSCPPNSPYLEKAMSTYTEFYLVYSTFDLEEYIKKEKERTNRSEFFIKNTYSMEAVGIEVIRTVLKLNLNVKYPSNKYSFRFGLACFK
jgi:predicted metal-binding protein